MNNFYKKYLKRILDFILAFLLVIIFSPILLLVFLVLFLNFNEPVFFLQVRVGLDNKLFSVYKFRTMKSMPTSDIVDISKDSSRLTIFGSFLRKTSLDELPQLFNVLNGDMSLVGPRPLLVEYLPLYNKIQARRHQIRPGITGWAQVNGRNTISWEKKFEYDVWYVDNCSFLLDIKILLYTIRKIIEAKDINSTDSVTTKKFQGNI